MSAQLRGFTHEHAQNARIGKLSDAFQTEKLPEMKVPRWDFRKPVPVNNIWNGMVRTHDTILVDVQYRARIICEDEKYKQRKAQKNQTEHRSREHLDGAR
eukprot:918887_1